jgi:hypothetical protein
MTSAAILNLLTRRRKRPEPTAEDRALELMRYRVRHLGDVEREMNDWRDSYRLRTGRAA